jgi:quercetin dioxygenase-like cupin family protein
LRLRAELARFVSAELPHDNSLACAPHAWVRLTQTINSCERRAMNKRSLTALAREHLEAAHRSPQGRSAHTIYGGHERVLRQTLIALVGGTALDEHDSPGEATLHVLQGRVRLASGADSWDGAPGDHLDIPPARHSLEALEDSAVVLTVAKSNS